MHRSSDRVTDNAGGACGKIWDDEVRNRPNLDLPFIGEVNWESANPTTQPAFRIFRHAMDGINDSSCGEKVGSLLRRHGYPGELDFILQGGRRSLTNHLWQDEYNRPVLDFFLSQLKREKR